MRNRLPPFECEIEALGPRGVGRATAPDGRPVDVRFAPPGGRLAVVPTGRAKGGWTARRVALIRPPAEWAEPRCAQFALCGGCALQELGLAAQRRHKLALGLAEVEAGYGPLAGVTVHGIDGAPDAYGYRNKVELAFGPTRFLREHEHQAGHPITGRFLGFHAPGRFDRVVDSPRCELVSEAANRVIAAVRGVYEAEGSPPPYDPRDHTGFWRHLVVREGHDGVLAVLFTAEAPDAEAWAMRVAEAVEPHTLGFQWRVNLGVADVARGELRRQVGRAEVEERLGPVALRLSPSAFFQTNTAGARVLYDTIGRALAPASGTLLDLYCGVGAIGLYLASRFDAVLGIEENPEAVVDARANAAANGIAATFVAGRVEDELLRWADRHDAHLVVDPPRAGLHPRAAAAVAAGRWASLVYVACNPASLGRDAAVLRDGGWRLTDLWAVDLFPHTGHLELVGRFVRGGAASQPIDEG
ncbi:MAG: 23S rRNA (uracil(1939)-C(5))-methyltransferase RlmD [Myxococcota bacterium]